MFNVAVIRLKDLVRYMVLLTGIIVILILGKRYYNSIKGINIAQKFSTNVGKYVEKAINSEIPATQKKDKEVAEEKEKMKSSIYEKMIDLQLGFINIQETNSEEIKIAENEVKKEKDKEQEEKGEEKQEEKKQEEKIEQEEEKVKTEVTTKNPLADAYTKKYKGVKIKNETSYDLTDNDLDYSKLKINKSNIIIFHTHTCESYTSSEKYSYTPTGNFRTTDKKYSVVRVGDKLTKYLKKYNINVVHNSTYHDYPAYTGSYSRSATTVKNLLKSTKADIIIDLHRDAIGSNSAYAPTVKIGEETCAQLMFVMGSNGGGLKHDNWKENLKFAVKMQELANKSYPGLFKPIILRNSRYNQNLSKAACIIEVGSTGNTLEQCLNSMKYLSKIINDFK